MVIIRIMPNDLVSVIIPSYNRFEYLTNAINSVLNQTYKNFEIIVVNDASTQKEYYDNVFEDKVNFVNLKENQTQKYPGLGPGKVRNSGIDIAKGKYLAFLDDDDLWLPQKLEVQISSLENSACKMSSTEGYFGDGVYNDNKSYQLYNKERFYKTLKKKYRGSGLLKRGAFPEIWDLDFLKIHNCIITSSVMVEKKIFDIVGGFRGIPAPTFEDYDCWLGILHHTSSLYIDKPLFYYDSMHGKGREY